MIELLVGAVTAAAVALTGYAVGQRRESTRAYERGQKAALAAMGAEMRRARIHLLELSGMSDEAAYLAYREWMRDEDGPLARRARKVLGVRA